MFHKEYRFLLGMLLAFVAAPLYAQEDILVLNPYDGSAGSFFMAQIKADTAANHGILPNRVYVLKRGGVYLNTEILNVPAGSTLRLRAEDGTGAKPVIYQYPTGTGATPQRPPGNLFVLLGSNLYMKNIVVSGYFEPVDTNLNNVQGGLVNTTQPGSSIIVDSCILTNINGQHLRTGAAAVKVQVTNSIFANMGALSTSNLGAGKGIDLREVSVDSLVLVNNTFVNYQDRVVRHYNFTNPEAGTGGLGYTLIDHNTFLNGMGFHGLLSLGNVGKKVTITNNLFLDAFACGEDTGDVTRSAEWANTGEKYPNGNYRMSWIFSAPNDTTVWQIRNNYYGISDSGQAYLNDFRLTENIQLSWHISARLGADSATAFKKVTVAMKNIPRLMTNEMRWYRSPGGGNMTKNTPSSLWHSATDDMDRRVVKYFADSMNCSFTADVNLGAAGTDSRVIGDSRWTFNGVVAPVKPVVTIAQARTDANSDMKPDRLGDTVQVFGVITTPNLSSTVTSYFIQDGTAAIDVFYNGTLDRTFKVGDSVAVTGKIAQYRGLTEITPLQPDSAYFGYLKHNASLPVAEKISLHQFVQNPEAYEARLVQIDSLYKLSGTWGSGGEITMINKAGTDTAIVYINAGTNVAGFKEPQYPINVTAVVNQYSSGSSVVTGGYELVPTDSAKIIVLSVQDRHTGIPKEFYMGPGYPNPFNPTTTIEFGLPKASNVGIYVYNVIGQRVAILQDGRMNAGNYKMIFNANRLASGVYFYVMHAGEKVFKQKLLLLK